MATDRNNSNNFLWTGIITAIIGIVSIAVFKLVKWYSKKSPNLALQKDGADAGVIVTEQEAAEVFLAQPAQMHMSVPPPRAEDTELEEKSGGTEKVVDGAHSARLRPVSPRHLPNSQPPSRVVSRAASPMDSDDEELPIIAAGIAAGTASELKLFSRASSRIATPSPTHAGRIESATLLGLDLGTGFSAR